MKRKRKTTPRQDSPVLDQLARLIDARLPDGHGFALLTFPLGAAVDPVTRYVGKGHREDILGLMEQWIAHQRGHGWGHDPSTAATQFTTAAPVTPGLYVLKTDHPTFNDPELVKLVEADGHLQVHQWNCQGFEATHDFVHELKPENHIWLGPLPEPWVQPDGQIAFPRDPNAGDPEAQHRAMAAHHAPRFEGLTEAYYAEIQARTTTPDEPIPDHVKALIQEAVAHGFSRGIVAQMTNPYRPKA